MATQTFIKTNSEGKPWTAIRQIKGKPTIVTKMLSGDTYVELPAATALAIINGPTATPAPKQPTTSRTAQSARYLRDLTTRLARGEVH